MLDWTSIIDTSISTFGAIASTVIGLVVYRMLRTPSGDRPGAVIERTHDLAAVGVAAMGNVSKAVGARGHTRAHEASGGDVGLIPEPGAGLQRSVDRLNDDPNGAVQVNGKENDQ